MLCKDLSFVCHVSFHFPVTGKTSTLVEPTRIFLLTHEIEGLHFSFEVRHEWDGINCDTQIYLHFSFTHYHSKKHHMVMGSYV